MQLGLIFALLAAVFFGANLVTVRRGVSKEGESSSAVIISVAIGTLFFAFSLLFTDDWHRLWSLSWRGFALLAGAGILNFIVGRFLLYIGVRLIGANRTAPILNTSTLYSVSIGVIFLHEPLTVFLILGAVCIAGGASLVSDGKEEGTSKIQGRGVLSALAGAVCLGTSAVLIKLGVAEVGSPFAAAFISYAAAFIIMLGLLFDRTRRERIVRLPSLSLILFILAGIFAAMAHAFRYLALSRSPVSVVQPLVSTSVLSVLIVSLLINRNIEMFNWRVYTGTAAAIAGIFLLFR